MSNKPLTIKEQKFIRFYLETGNATEAVWRSYDVKRRVTAAVMAKQIKKKSHIQEAIRFANLDEDSIRNMVIKNLTYIASLRPKRTTMNQVIKARSLLLKLKAYE